MTGARPGGPVEPDFAGILQLARVKAEETRREHRAAITALFGDRRALLTDRQRGLLNNLLRQLVHDIESTLNQFLLARTEGETWVARETLESVYRGESAGSFERLAASGMLSDLALIEAVMHRLYEYQLDRALNRPAPRDWPGAVEPAREEAPEAMLPIDDRGVRDRLEAYAVDRSLRTDPYGNPVIDTVELEPELLARLHWMVAAVLRETLLMLAPSRRSEIDLLVEETVAAALDRAAARAATGTRAAAVAEAVYEAGRLDCALVMTALRRGEVPLFEALLIRLVRLRPVLVRRLLYEPGGEGLAVAMRAVGMRHEDFAELYAIVRTARLERPAGETEDVARITGFFDRLPDSAVALVHEYWQRRPELLGALWQLEAGEKRSESETR